MVVKNEILIFARLHHQTHIRVYIGPSAYLINIVTLCTGIRIRIRIRIRRIHRRNTAYTAAAAAKTAQ
jgi:hypothetical protein